MINKRAGGMGLISRPQGVPEADGRTASTLLNAIQDVYLSSDVTIA